MQDNHKDYLTPQGLLYVLKAQAFRFKHINLVSCIEEAFGIKAGMEEENFDAWRSTKINFKTFYEACIAPVKHTIN